MPVALVVGYGSIGRRHAHILHDLGCRVEVVSKRATNDFRRFASITDALHSSQLDYVVIANDTSEHEATLDLLKQLGFVGRVLVEKPLTASPVRLHAYAFDLAAVGYNLRFHPILVDLVDRLRGDRIIAAKAYCGQHLGLWRRDRDYRAAYSADPGRGGGVLRDLSHELDYMQWLCGTWQRVAAIGGRFSDLEIRSDDCWGMLMELEACPVATLQINYLDRPGARALTINTASHTYRVDLVANTLECDGKTNTYAINRDDTYRAQHKAVLDRDTERLCLLTEGATTVALIAATEQAARTGAWVAR